MTSLEKMDDLVLDDLVDFLQTSDELSLPAALTLDDMDHDGLLFDAQSFLSSTTPDLLPLDLVPELNNIQSTDILSSEHIQVPVVKTQQQQQRSKDAIRRSIYRQRQKEEKETLRHEIEELSVQLTQLENSSGPQTIPQSTDLALSNCLWKAIASRQHERRQDAEEEQLRLRAAISSRGALIEDLCGFLKKRVHEGSTGDSNVVDKPRVQKRMRLDPSDSALFETFIQELHTVYLQADEVIRSCESELATGSPTVTKHKDGTTEYFQHTDRQSLPFNFQQTCHSMWRIAHLSHRQEGREVYDGVGDPDNTIAMKFRITSRRMGETVSLLQRIVVRRFEETNRVVVVWKLFTEGEGLFRGMHSDETGWCVARPSTNCSQAGTVLDTCFRHVPMHFSSSSSKEVVVNEFTDMIISTGAEDNQVVFKALEKMLIDDELAYE